METANGFARSVKKYMKKLKFAKPKKVSISYLKKKLLDLVKAEVRRRDDYTCQHCLKYVTGSGCHVSHVIPVSHGNRLMFEPLNMKVLCFHCHIDWWHKNPLEASKWFKETFSERYNYLQSHKNEKVHWKEADYKEMIENYK